MIPKPAILIVCYSFPPFPGIGGRRWAKFAKYLQRMGFGVNVIASQNPFNRESEWMKDVTDVPVNYLPLKYPQSLITFPRTIFGRVRYRLDLFYVKIFTRGNYYDRTVFWKEQLLKEASLLIEKKKIDHLIVTGAPFSLFSHVANLKQKFPDLKLVADVRDPWTNNETAYSYDSLSEKRMAYEKQIERSVFNVYDKVICVNQEMTRYFQDLYPGAKNKFLTVMNGFDPEETQIEADNSCEINATKINLVFTGSFYEKAIDLFDDLLTAVEELDKNGSANKLHFYFFGPNVSVLNQRLVNRSIKDKFTFGNFTSISKVNWLISHSDYALLFLTDDIDYSFSTKFCEYIKLRKKMLVFSKTGLTGKYVEEKKIGIHVKPGEELNALLSLISDHPGKPFPNEFDVSDFSVKKLTADIAELLQ